MNRDQSLNFTSIPSDRPFQSAFNSVVEACYPIDSPMRSKFLPNYYQYRVDKKTIDSVIRRLDKLINLCRDPRVVLRNSPPYLLDILPDIAEKLRNIMFAYQGSLDELFRSVYFQVFLFNLNEKCELISKLFKEAKEKMYDDHSEPRIKLTKYSLVLSHILKDLEALFPNNRYAPEAFRITKREAADWWKQNFGESAIVAWELFRTRLFATFGTLDRSESRELQSTIDLTCNYYVSIFEFDVFVRLFQPWTNVLETWRALTIMHAGYMAFMTYDEVKAVLKKFRGHPGPGSYVYRLSCTKLGQWAIGYITENFRILQTIIQNKSLAQALLDGEQDGFYLYPNGTPSQSSILTPLVRNITQTHIQVSEEQYQLYSRIGSTFEVCKICTENNKNIRLEPCGHLLCKTCLVNCQNTGNGQTCPFCRLEVKSTEEVVLDPFIPKGERESGITRLIPEVKAEEEEGGARGRDEEQEIDSGSQGSGETMEIHGFDPRFHDKEVNAEPPILPPRPTASTSTEVDSVVGDTIEPTSTESSPKRRRNPSSCCSRAMDLEAALEDESTLLITTEEVPRSFFDTASFMQRSDVQAVDSSLSVNVAQHLLEICEGNADIAARVWRDFIPRS
ncbi:unnamed protein product [Hymenolepis diminuta]|uniref:E3 ubiquitin-protein ligase CBL n=1 Tax=Hymenolepis diminuta TaxID=6216 RepID=A0A0R3SR78_HYMDI|nr:unnamed protein product [Hymenolepis diminuta]VUZ54993.1 unnamed protein product [Hymenolepis diminuta]